MHNYASLHEIQDQEEQGILFHVSEPTRSRWNHIEDLDSFFTRVYKYHQKHGFACMVIQEICNLNQFVFICFLTTYLMFGIDYGKLFNPDPTKHQSLTDILIPIREVIKNLPFIGWFLVTFISLCFFLKLVRKFYAMVMFWDIKQFYNTALHIDDGELDNLTWYDIQTRLKQVQLELQMCIHKRELTELDIYHRILRQTNYVVAMVNKRLLPPRTYLPILGEMVYWTKGLRYNVMFLFFWSPWSPFENPWHLREEYKRPAYREKLANQLGRQMLWLCLLNLIASPLIFFWQIMFYFFNYFETVRREPGKFGVRYWSQYGRLYLRHFNELDHELHSRLTRAYRPATKYLGAFNSPIMSAIAEHVAFLFSATFAVFLVAGFYDNEIVYMDKVLSIMATLTMGIALARSLVPDETTIWCPETLLQAVVLHTHYLPGNWQGQAHTSHIKASFQQLFQYRFAALLEEFFSPILTPYFLVRYLYPRRLDIVDFFRNFTVSVVGVGDVCSFAQMDIRKHGNPDWQTTDASGNEVAYDQYTQAEDGKVELSLMHFTATNPDWEPPLDAKDFVDNVQLESNRAFNDFGLAFNSSMDLDAQSIPPTMDRRTSFVPGQSTMSFNAAMNLHGARSAINWRAEGPDLFTSANNMRASTLVLHNRFANRASIRQVRSAEETTPLLSNK